MWGIPSISHVQVTDWPETAVILWRLWLARNSCDLMTVLTGQKQLWYDNGYDWLVTAVIWWRLNRVCMRAIWSWSGKVAQRGSPWLWETSSPAFTRADAQLSLESWGVILFIIDTGLYRLQTTLDVVPLIWLYWPSAATCYMLKFPTILVLYLMFF